LVLHRLYCTAPYSLLQRKTTSFFPPGYSVLARDFDVVVMKFQELSSVFCNYYQDIRTQLPPHHNQFTIQRGGNRDGSLSKPRKRVSSSYGFPRGFGLLRQRNRSELSLVPCSCTLYFQTPFFKIPPRTNQSHLPFGLNCQRWPLMLSFDIHHKLSACCSSPCNLNACNQAIRFGPRF
jgi:hypothetical protein